MKISPRVKKILSHISGCNYKENVSLKSYTSFKVGGPADVLVEPDNIEALQKILKTLTENAIPFFILGKGSNLLVGDRGYRGVVLRLNRLDQYKVKDTTIIAQAGISLAKLAAIALDQGLTGLEFASGIPGSLGGAIVMNAGAYGGEMKDVVNKVVALTLQGEKKVLNREEAQLGYRKSIFQENGWIVIEVEMELKKGVQEEIRAQMNELNMRRKEKQPLEFPSAGSTFKRPPGHYAGALIEQAGLKGFSIGDAQVSEKHAGFIINKGEATAKDILALINYVQKKVKEVSGIELIPEVHIIGEF